MQIPHLKCEIYLLSECLFEGVLAYWYLQSWWHKWSHVAQEEEKVNVPLDMLIDIRVPDLDSHFSSSIFGSVDLTHWAWGDGNRVKLLEDVLNGAAILLLEVLSSGFEWMSGCVLPQILEFVGQLRSNNISAMAQVLEGLDEDDSRPFHSFDEEIQPIVLGAIKK